MFDFGVRVRLLGMCFDRAVKVEWWVGGWAAAIISWVLSAGMAERLSREFALASVYVLIR